MKSWPIIAVLTIIFCFQGKAQVSLSLEGRGARKVLEFYPEQSIIYKTEGDKNWNYQQIVRMDSEHKLLYFENGYVHIDDIIKIKRNSSNQLFNQIGNGMLLFGAQWLTYSSLATFSNYTFTSRDLKIAGTAGLLGVLLKLISGSRTYKVGKGKRLRIRDLRWQIPDGA